jgi:hypothetical protein
MAQHIPIIIMLSIEGRESKQANEKLYCQNYRCAMLSGNKTDNVIGCTQGKTS